jgi:hypothetical protein
MLSRRAALSVAILVAGSVLGPAHPAAAVQDPPCSEAQLVWARGTDRDPLTDPEFAIISSELQDRLGWLGPLQGDAAQGRRKVAC